MAASRPGCAAALADGVKKVAGPINHLEGIAELDGIIMDEMHVALDEAMAPISSPAPSVMLVKGDLFLTH